MNEFNLCRDNSHPIARQVFVWLETGMAFRSSDMVANYLALQGVMTSFNDFINEEYPTGSEMLEYLSNYDPKYENVGQKINALEDRYINYAFSCLRKFVKEGELLVFYYENDMIKMVEPDSPDEVWEKIM